MTAAATRLRKIVHIDPDKCDGCGQCVPSCAEGAIRIVAGKARLVGENLCDGLGACLGTCPRDAIRIEERSAAEFDHAAVQAHLARNRTARSFSGRGAGGEGPAADRPAAAARPPAGLAMHPGCPGARLRSLDVMTPPSSAPRPAGPGQPPAAPAASKLRQWPVQLALLPTAAPIWQDADLLLAADCVAFAVPDFHDRLLAGRTLAIACPKLDDPAGYVDKLAEIFAANPVRSVTVAHMEVPCCVALERIARLALDRAGRDIPLRTLQISIRGQMLPADH